jgi:hypothetical protein
MKVNNRQPQGSFGIPEKAVPTAPEENKKEDAPVQKSEVDLIQESLGIEFTEEDFQQLLFKGSVDKEVVILPGRLKAIFHSLDVDEWQEVDELLTEEVNDVPMTKEGLEVRRGLLSISYGITHLQGAPLSQPIMDKKKSGKLDTRKMAKERRRKIGEMSPAVVNIMLAKHASFTRMLDMITAASGDHLKNS